MKLNSLVRQLLGDLPDSDEKAFILDHFPSVHRTLSDGMDRRLRVTHLLDQVEADVILRNLREYYLEHRKDSGIARDLAVPRLIEEALAAAGKLHPKPHHPPGESAAVGAVSRMRSVVRRYRLWLAAAAVVGLSIFFGKQYARRENANHELLRGVELLRSKQYLDALQSFRRALLDGSESHALPFWIAEAARPVEALVAVFKQWSTTVVALSPDGELLVTAGEEGRATLWSVAGKPLARLEGGKADMQSVKFSPDGRRVLATSKGDAVLIWDVQSGALLQTLSGASKAGDAVAWSHDGKFVALESGKVLKIWDTQTGILKIEQPLESSATEVQFSSDDSHLLVVGSEQGPAIYSASNLALSLRLQGHRARVHWGRFLPRSSQIITAAENGELGLWDGYHGRLLGLSEGSGRSTGGVALSPSGRRVLVIGEDRTVRIYEVPIFSHRWAAPTLLTGHAKTIVSAAFHPNEEEIVTASTDGTVRLWEVSTGQERAVFATNVTMNSSMLGAVFTPDGSRVVAGLSAGAVLFDSRRQRLRATLRKRSTEVPANSSPRQAIWSPDKKSFLDIDGSIAELIETETGIPKCTLTMDGTQITSATFRQDAHYLIVGAKDRTARVWNTWECREVEVLRGHSQSVQGVDFAPAGDAMLTVGNEGLVRLWNDTTGDSYIKLPVEGVRTAKWSPDGRHILVHAEGSAIWVFDAQHPESGRLLRPADLSPEFMSWHPNSNKVLLGGGGNSFAIFNIDNGGAVLPYSQPALNAYSNVQFSRDGKVVLATTRRPSIELLAVDHEPITSLLEIPAPPDQELVAALSETGLIASGCLASSKCQDKAVRILDSELGQELFVLPGHTGGVSSMSFGSDGRRLLTIDGQGTLRLFDVGASRWAKQDLDGLVKCWAPEPGWFAADDALVDGFTHSNPACNVFHAEPVLPRWSEAAALPQLAMDALWRRDEATAMAQLKQARTWQLQLAQKRAPTLELLFAEAALARRQGDKPKATRLLALAKREYGDAALTGSRTAERWMELARRSLYELGDPELVLQATGPCMGDGALISAKSSCFEYRQLAWFATAEFTNILRSAVEFETHFHRSSPLQVLALWAAAVLAEDRPAASRWGLEFLRLYDEVPKVLPRLANHMMEPDILRHVQAPAQARERVLAAYELAVQSLSTAQRNKFQEILIPAPQRKGSVRDRPH